jgi:hypothetical protein
VIALVGAAIAADLPALAERDGFVAVHDALDALAASSRPKRLAEDLAAAGLGRVTMPVSAALGADLVITSAGPLGGCAWSDGAVACDVPLRTTTRVTDGEYAVTCTSRFGASLPVPSVLASGATSERAVLRLPDVRPCWKLGADALRVTPVAGAELEGVGQGTDLIPPELVGLTKRQVEETVQQHAGAFRHCLVSEGRTGLTGKLVVAYHIGPDGHLDEVVAESSTLGDAAVEGCILARFRTITFPRPNDGYDRGTWPVTFQ